MAKRFGAKSARELAREGSGRKAPPPPPGHNSGTLDVLEDGEVREATDAQINAVKDIAREQVKLKRSIEQVSEDLANLQQDLDRNRGKLLPEAMAACGMEQFELQGGYGVKVSRFVRASVPQPDSKTAENAEERHKIGIAKAEEVCPDLVEHSITFFFQRGEEESLFRKFMAQLGRRKNPPRYVIKDVINAQRLSAWVRRKDEALEPVPEEEFNVHRATVADVTMPKKKVL